MPNCEECSNTNHNICISCLKAYEKEVGKWKKFT